MHFLRKFQVQNQRSKDGEIARLNDTIKSQNKRIIQLEETVDRLQQVKILTKVQGGFPSRIKSYMYKLYINLI